MILKCTCVHKFQDEKYGLYNRVHNQSGKESNKARCTVCGNVRDIGKIFKQEEKKENGN